MNTNGRRRADACELCLRAVAHPTRHHLVPRTRQKGTRERERIAWLCAPCHKQIHVLLSEKELERAYDTIEKLAAHPEVARFVRWVAKRPDGTHVPTRRAGRARRR